MNDIKLHILTQKLDNQNERIRRLEKLIGELVETSNHRSNPRAHVLETSNHRSNPRTHTRCFHEDRVWVTGRVVKECYHTGDELRERTQYCRTCGVETDSETFWD